MSQTALIVIDVQESFRRPPELEAVNHPDIADRVEPPGRRRPGQGRSGRLGAAHRTGHRWRRSTRPSGHVRLIDGLEPIAGEPVITKTSHNAFTTTNLQQLLTQHGVREVVICGIRTEQCCETTTRVAVGPRATTSCSSPRRPRRTRCRTGRCPPTRPLDEILADPRTLGTEEIVERTEYALAGRFATIRTLDELTGVPVPS